jgi:chemotaxis protein methyltransferase CheR
MTDPIPENTIEALSRVISRQTGLYFPENKWKTLTKGVSAVIRDLGMDMEGLIQSLQSEPSKEIIDALTARLTIGETYFLRDKNFFQILQDHILRGIITHPKRSEKKIIFWSAACATGEEPYSIAILAQEMLPVLKDWDITIIGSDINPTALEKARKGIYSTWSLRETPQKIIKKYFTPKPGGWFEIAPQIRQKVSFYKLNLMEENYTNALSCYEPIDIILCRNVLMYFNDQGRNATLDKLSARLIENGWLITGPAESGFVNLPDFTSVRFPGALYHRKGPPRIIVEAPPSVRMPKKKQPAVPAPSSPAHRRITDKPRDRRIMGSLDARPSGQPKYDIYQEAVKDYDRGDYSQAINRLLGIMSENQSHSNAFLMKTESMILLAKAYANIGDLVHAGAWCEKAIETEKLNPEIYYLLATLSHSAGERDASVKSLKQSIYLDPEFIMAHFTLGMLLVQEGMKTEGRKSMQNALALLELKDAEEIPPCSEGITAGRLIETIKSMKIK